MFIKVWARGRAETTVLRRIGLGVTDVGWIWWPGARNTGEESGSDGFLIVGGRVVAIGPGLQEEFEAPRALLAVPVTVLVLVLPVFFLDVKGPR